MIIEVELDEIELELIRIILECFKQIKSKNEEEFKKKVSEWIGEKIKEDLDFWR